MRYTEKIHAEGLLYIFETIGVKACSRCPKYIMQEKYCPSKSWNRYDKDLINSEYGCTVCWEFVLKENEEPWDSCPCYGGNEFEAEKRTWLALEEKGYI